MFELQSEATDKIDAALAKAQGEFKAAIKDSKNPHFKSDYADLASYVEASREPLAKHGISVIQTPWPHDGTMYLVTQLRCQGQWLRSYYPMAFGTNPQANGSAMTYARRYALGAMLGIAPDDPDMADDDGNRAADEAKRNPPRQQQRHPARQQAQKTDAPPVTEDEPPADPRAGTKAKLVLTWADGKTREFDRTKGGAIDFVKAAKSAVAANPKVLEAGENRAQLEALHEKVEDLQADIDEIFDLFANPPAAAMAAAE